MKTLTGQEENPRILRVKKKLAFVLVGLSLSNFIIYSLSSGLEGNYTDFVDSITQWTIPLGSLMWGFILGTLLNFIPYRRYTYKNKYLVTVFSISILFNLLFLIVGISQLF